MAAVAAMLNKLVCCRQQPTGEPQKPPETQKPSFTNTMTDQKPTITYKALYSCEGVNTGDLAFKKGDLLEVDKPSETDAWWTATHKVTGETGYIPCNFVCKADNSPRAQEWWFDIGRRDTQRKLLLPGNGMGTFLVRASHDNTSFVLSVRHEGEDGEACVRHYRIRQDQGGGVYIAKKRTFNTVIDLVKHYKGDADGLCTTLTEACPRVRPVVHFRNLEVRRDEVVLSKKLGAGSFGEVVKGKLRNVIDVAVKTLKPGCMTSEAFLQEARIMHKLEHERLVQLVAVVTEDEPYLIMTEFMANGALLEYLRQDGGISITFANVVDMAAQIADGMAYLEGKKFIHRDLRAANILVGEQLEVKVADFGMARILEDDEVYTAQANAKFPIKWTAPEAAKRKAFSVKSDVWSFGVLLHELVTLGGNPYPGMAGRDLIDQLERGYRMPKPHSSLDYDDAYYEIMLTCWRDDPEDRPTFEHLRNTFDDFHVGVEQQYD